MLRGQRVGQLRLGGGVVGSLVLRLFVSGLLVAEFCGLDFSVLGLLVLELICELCFVSSKALSVLVLRSFVL